MKKNLLTQVKKLRYRKISYAFLLLTLVTAAFVSCRKLNSSVPNPSLIDPAATISRNDLLKWYNDLPAPAQADLDGVAGLSSDKGKLPFYLQWNKAQRRIIDGKDVVRVPINQAAAMAFVKMGKNGPIDAYVYKWLDKTKKGEKFSGRMLSLDMQTFKLQGEAYKNGKSIYKIDYKQPTEATPAQIKDLKTVLSATENT